MALKGIKVPVDFALDIDQAKLDALEKKLTALFEQNNIDINTDDAEAAVAQFMAQLEGLQPMLEQLELSVDAGEATAAIDAIADKLEGLDAADLQLSVEGLNDVAKAAAAFDELEASLEQQKKALAVMAAEGKEGTDEFTKLGAVVDANEAKVKQMRAAFEGAGKAVSGLGDTGNKALNFLAIAEAGNQLKDVFGGIVERGGEYNQTLKQIQAQTGLVGDALDEFKDQAKDAFQRGVGESAAEGLKILGQARTLFGKSFQGQELTDLTVSLNATAKAFDKEFGEVATRAASFQRSFNLDSKKTAELVTLALRDAKTVADDVLDTLGEYSPLIAQAGFSAEEFVGILTRAEGAFNTDKIADSIKELGIRLKAGDVQTGINDLVANFGQRIPAALSDTLTAVAQEGQAGLKSTADVLRESTALIEEAFSSGAIDKNIRQGLQAAFAGTPAEEFGSDLYARAFGAPINTALVEAQAAAAQATVDKAFKPTAIESFAKGFEALEQKVSAAFVPVAKGGAALADLAPKVAAIKNLIPEETFSKLSGSLSSAFGKGLDGITKQLGPLKDKVSGLGPAMFGPWGIAIAAVTGLLVLFFTQTEEGAAIFDGIKEAVMDLYEQAKPALEAIGSVLATIGKLVWELLIRNFELLIDIVGGVVEAVGSLFSSGDSADGEGFKEFFAAIVDGAEKAKLFIEGIIAAFKSLKDNVGAALKALITGDLSGFADALGSIGEDAAQAFQKGVDEAADKLETKKLQDKVSAALTIQGNLDQNDALGALVEKFKGATDEVTKQNLAAQIAAQVPSAVQSVKTVVDETTGKVTEVYDIALDKAEQYVADQNAALSQGVEGGKDAFYQLLVKQSEELDNNKAKLQDMANQITAAAARGEDVTKLTKEYEKQKEATEKSAEGLKNVVTQGKGLGVTAEEVAKLGKKAGDSAEDTEKLSAKFKLADQEVRKTAVSAKVLGDAFTQALSRVDGSLNTAVSALAGAQLKIRDLTRQIAAEKDPAKLQQLKQDLADVQATLPELNKQLKTSAVEQVNLQEIQARVGKTVERTQESRLAKNQRLLAQEQAQVELAARIVDLRAREARLLAGREEDVYDQLEATTNALVTQERLLKEQAESLGLSAEQAQLLLETVRETGSLDIKDEVAVKIGLRTAEGDQRFDLKAQLAQKVADVYEAGVNVLDVRAQIRGTIDPSELLQLAKDLEQRQFEVQVELGFKTPLDVLNRTQDQLEKLQERIFSFEQGVGAINERLSDPNLTAAERGRLEQRLVNYQTTIAQMKLEEIDLQQAVRASSAEIFDKRAALAQEAFDIQYTKAVAGYDRELEAANIFVNKKLELETAAIEEAKALELEAIDEVLAARMQALDEAKAVAEQNLELLDSFGLAGDEGIDTERELAERKLAIQRDYEEQRKAMEEQAAAEREAAERKAADRALALQKQAEGEALYLTAQRERAELELQRAGLEEQLQIAKAKADVSGLKADRDAADAIGRQLDALAVTIEDKGTMLQEISSTLQGGLSETFATLFSGNEEAITDSFRSLFSVLGGALKKAATAFIVDIVLTSPWLKTAIGINPLLGAAITAGVTGILSGIVNSLLDPVLSSLTSFASGGRIDSPMLALVGDATRLGGSSDREWIFRDEQLWRVVASATAGQTKMLTDKLDEIRELLASQRIVGVLQGNDIQLAAQGVSTAKAMRQREP